MTCYSEAAKAARANHDRAHLSAVRFIKAAGVDVGALTAGGASGGLGGMIGGSQGQRRIQMAYAAFKGHVYSCITVIAKRLASLPVGAGEIINDDQHVQQDDAGKGSFGGTKAGMRPMLKRLLPASVKAAATAAQVQAFLTHPALDLMNKPNPVQGKFEFLFTWVANMYLAGEAYWIGGDGEDGTELWMPPTTWIVPKHEGGLFTGYELKPAGASTGVPLEPEMVYRTYFPDPADPKGCVSPVVANLSAITVDESIQRSQEEMFKRGIFPNVVLTVGDRRNADGTPGGMPRLEGPQRRQLIHAVREVWRATTSNGDPAIVDGLISGIHKLNNMPAEMDWLNSGEQVKKRIYQAFGVNPIIVGEIAGANRAQAAVAEQNFLSNVINPLADDVTVVLNEFVAPMVGGGTAKVKAAKDEKSGDTKLYLWLEEGQPLDDELKLRKFTTARTNNDVSRNEFRTEVLGLPPIEEEDQVKRVPLLDTVGGGQVIVQVLSAVGMGSIGTQSAIEAFKLLFELDDAAAQALVADTGDIGAVAQEMAAQPPEPPPGRDTPPPMDDGDDDEEASEEPPDSEDAGKSLVGITAAKSGVPIIKRSSVKSNHRRQQARLEKEAAGRLRPFSKASIARLLRSLHGSQTAS